MKQRNSRRSITKIIVIRSSEAKHDLTVTLIYTRRYTIEAEIHNSINKIIIGLAKVACESGYEEEKQHEQEVGEDALCKGQGEQQLR